MKVGLHVGGRGRAFPPLARLVKVGRFFFIDIFFKINENSPTKCFDSPTKLIGIFISKFRFKDS